MRQSFPKCKLLLALLLLTAGFAQAASNYIKPSDVSWETILSGPPAADSDQQKQEIATLLEWQNKRTATDIKRCQSEVNPDPFIFSEVIGDKFIEKNLPITATLLKDTAADVKAITKLAKAHWDRKRPPAVDSRIKPCVDLETNASYPSAHATRGIVWARILGEIFPDQKDKLLERGKQIGDDRFIAGIHFPSDVAAGQQLGDAIFDQLMKNPGFVKSLDEAKKECAAIGK
jgi:hypothetical protein